MTGHGWESAWPPPQVWSAVDEPKTRSAMAGLQVDLYPHISHKAGRAAPASSAPVLSCWSLLPVGDNRLSVKSGSPARHILSFYPVS